MARLVKHKNIGYSPYESQIDLFESCTVCGYPIDADRTTYSDNFSAMSQTVTGTTYHPGAGATEAEWRAVDKVTTTNITPYAACPLCGSGNWRQASGPEGLSPYA